MDIQNEFIWDLMKIEIRGPQFLEVYFLFVCEHSEPTWDP